MRRSALQCSLSILLASSCVTNGSSGSAPATLVISSLEGGPGDDEAVFRQTFASDVLTGGRVIEDGGRVALALVLKDPGSLEHPTTPSSANWITIHRYRVRYIRADGRAVPGVDVPYAFDGAMTFTVGADGGVGRFVIVRAQAKLEPPLISLRGGGGSVALSTLAEVTLHGRDQTGHDVAVTGLVGVNFADWADEE